MSDGSFISPRNPCHGRTYVEDETDRIVAHLDARAREAANLSQRLPESDRMDAGLFATRCACLRDEIDGGMHR